MSPFHSNSIRKSKIKGDANMAAITKQLVQQVDQWIARHRDEMVDEVCRLIRFPSVADPNGVPPYGQNCREVLDA